MTGLAIGAPLPIIRDHFGGHLRAARSHLAFLRHLARTVPRPPIPRPRAETPSAAPRIGHGGRGGGPAPFDRRRSDRGVDPAVRAINLEEETA